VLRRTCATRDDEPRPVWTSLPIKHCTMAPSYIYRPKLSTNGTWPTSLIVYFNVIFWANKNNSQNRGVLLIIFQSNSDKKNVICGSTFAICYQRFAFSSLFFSRILTGPTVRIFLVFESTIYMSYPLTCVPSFLFFFSVYHFSLFFLRIVHSALSSLALHSLEPRGYGWRIHCGVEVTEMSTKNNTHTLTHDLTHSISRLPPCCIYIHAHTHTHTHTHTQGARNPMPMPNPMGMGGGMGGGGGGRLGAEKN
jgi:hypothetical protein